MEILFYVDFGTTERAYVIAEDFQQAVNKVTTQYPGIFVRKVELIAPNKGNNEFESIEFLN